MTTVPPRGEFFLEHFQISTYFPVFQKPTTLLQGHFVTMYNVSLMITQWHGLTCHSVTLWNNKCTIKIHTQWNQ